jgi:hypothetical protein
MKMKGVVRADKYLRRVLIRYSDTTWNDIRDLMYSYGGYFDGDRREIVMPFSEELVEELENRGIRFTVELL